MYLLNRRKLEIEEEAAKLSDRVQNLQKLYEQQDTILSNFITLESFARNFWSKIFTNFKISDEIFGSSYSSKTESELDRLRNYRDTLYNGELAWQDAIKLAQSAAMFSQAGFSSWQTIHMTA